MAQVVASLTALIGADTKGFEAGAKKVKGGMSDIGRSIAGAIPQNIAQFASLSTAITAVGFALKNSVDETVKYANEVRQLSSLSGATAEDTSRLIQVIDDYKLSADDALMATKALTAQGYTPSIDTLAKLSDTYLSLNSVQAKNEFVLKNLGKGGLKWVEVLEKGSKAIKEQGAAVDKSLILNDKALKQAREYEMAMDNWNDSVLALKISIGNQLLPTLTTFTRGITDSSAAAEEGIATWEKFIPPLYIFHREYLAVQEMLNGTPPLMDDNAEAAAGMGAALSDIADPTKEAEKALKDYQDALESVSQANQDMEDMSRSIATDQRDYVKDHADAIHELGSAQVDLMDAQKKGDESAIEDATEAVNEQQKAIQELEATWHESANNMIYDMILVGLSAGGLLESELRAADEYAVKQGIKTQADIDEANRRRDIADSTIEGILQSEDVLAEQRKIDAETLRLENEITGAAVVSAANDAASAINNVSASTDGEIARQKALAAAARITAGAYAGIKYGGSSLNTGKPYVAMASATGGKSPDERGHALGGDFLIPQSYGNEGFRLGNGDTASGGERISITPKGQQAGGVTYNIVINNPKREAAETSITATLKNLAYTGAAV